MTLNSITLTHYCRALSGLLSYRFGRYALYLLSLAGAAAAIVWGWG